jgi:hypothetical protein
VRDAEVTVESLDIVLDDVLVRGSRLPNATFEERTFTFQNLTIPGEASVTSDDLSVDAENTTLVIDTASVTARNVTVENTGGEAEGNESASELVSRIDSATVGDAQVTASGVEVDGTVLEGGEPVDEGTIDERTVDLAGTYTVSGTATAGGQTFEVQDVTLTVEDGELTLQDVTVSSS